MDIREIIGNQAEGLSYLKKLSETKMKNFSVLSEICEARAKSFQKFRKLYGTQNEHFLMLEKLDEKEEGFQRRNRLIILDKFVKNFTEASLNI